MSTRRARDATFNLHKATSEVVPDLQGVANSETRKLKNRRVQRIPENPQNTDNKTLIFAHEILEKLAGKEMLDMSGRVRASKNIIWVFVVTVVILNLCWVIRGTEINRISFENEMRVLNEAYEQKQDGLSLDFYLRIADDIRERSQEDLSNLYKLINQPVFWVIVVGIIYLLGRKIPKIIEVLSEDTFA